MNKLQRIIQYLNYTMDDLDKNNASGRLYSTDKAKMANIHISNYLMEIKAELEKYGVNRELFIKIDTLTKPYNKEELKKLIMSLSKVHYEPTLKFNVKIPLEIRQEMLLDLNEMDRCFKASCYRSSLILCARILETCLHRKYYEVTGKDILETSPEIGLGKLIAKLTERDVHFDPGILQQIHLLNKIRIHSVHKKQDLFQPTINQTKAIMILTIELVNKLFEK